MEKMNFYTGWPTENTKKNSGDFRGILGGIFRGFQGHMSKTLPWYIIIEKNLFHCLPDSQATTYHTIFEVRHDCFQVRRHGGLISE